MTVSGLCSKSSVWKIASHIYDIISIPLRTSLRVTVYAKVGRDGKVFVQNKRLQFLAQTDNIIIYV